MADAKKPAAQTAEEAGTKIITSKVRWSYVHVWEPVAMADGQEKKYSVSLLIPKTDKELVAAINKAVEAAIQVGIPKWGGKKPANLKLPLRDGDKERQENPEYVGHWFISASSKVRPGIVDKKVQPIIDQSEVYSGCYGKASINFYPFNQAGNKGVACGLNHLQKLEDGEALGGRGSAEEDFQAEDDDITA